MDDDDCRGRLCSSGSAEKYRVVEEMGRRSTRHHWRRQHEQCEEQREEHERLRKRHSASARRRHPSLLRWAAGQAGSVRPVLRARLFAHGPAACPRLSRALGPAVRARLSDGRQLHATKAEPWPAVRSPSRLFRTWLARSRAAAARPSSLARLGDVRLGEVTAGDSRLRLTDVR